MLARRCIAPFITPRVGLFARNFRKLDIFAQPAQVVFLWQLDPAFTGAALENKCNLSWLIYFLR
jgi:hypothetical protein